MIININAARELRPVEGIGSPEIALSSGESVILRVATAFTCPETHANDAVVQVHLRTLCTAQHLDCAFIVLFDRELHKVDRLIAPQFDWIVSDPQAMAGAILPSNKLLKKRLGKHQLVDISGINECHGELALLAGCFANFNLQSLVVGGIVVRDAVAGLFVMGTSRARNQWQMDTYLTMRLMAATYAAGLERYLAGQAYYGVKVW